MKICLKYFSGTGNSYKILDTCKKFFINKGCEVELSSVTDEPDIHEEAGLIGFCFPVYAFGIPRICRQYLSGLPKFSEPVKAFVLITAGDPQEAGFSVRESNGILKAKGLDVAYSDVIHMPSNWIVAMNPPPKQEARLIISRGVKKAEQAARDILNGASHHHVFNYPPGYSKFGFYKDYYLFKAGVGHLWRNFRTDETCDACGLCEKICPTGSIRTVNERPEWKKTCEQCMRCANFCPKKAIFQKGEGSVKERNKYYEPTFKPLKLKKHEDR
ncbi:MAG: EFR1 family ferrodoxin [Desulfobacterales bacterium]|nr:EFR1 family ferrodoxin [Desulfobacterales bacterium]